MNTSDLDKTAYLVVTNDESCVYVGRSCWMNGGDIDGGGALYYPEKKLIILSPLFEEGFIDEEKDFDVTIFLSSGTVEINNFAGSNFIYHSVDSNFYSIGRNDENNTTQGRGFEIESDMRFAQINSEDGIAEATEGEIFPFQKEHISDEGWCRNEYHMKEYREGSFGFDVFYAEEFASGRYFGIGAKMDASSGYLTIEVGCFPDGHRVVMRAKSYIANGNVEAEGKIFIGESGEDSQNETSGFSMYAYFDSQEEREKQSYYFIDFGAADAHACIDRDQPYYAIAVDLLHTCSDSFIGGVYFHNIPHYDEDEVSIPESRLAYEPWKRADYLPDLSGKKRKEKFQSAKCSSGQNNPYPSNDEPVSEETASMIDDLFDEAKKVEEEKPAKPKGDGVMDFLFSGITGKGPVSEPNTQPVTPTTSGNESDVFSLLPDLASCLNDTTHLDIKPLKSLGFTSNFEKDKWYVGDLQNGKLEGPGAYMKEGEYGNLILGFYTAGSCTGISVMMETDENILFSFPSDNKEGRTFGFSWKRNGDFLISSFGGNGLPIPGGCYRIDKPNPNQGSQAFYATRNHEEERIDFSSLLKLDDEPEKLLPVYPAGKALPAVASFYTHQDDNHLLVGRGIIDYFGMQRGIISKPDGSVRLVNEDEAGFLVVAYEAEKKRIIGGFATAEEESINGLGFIVNRDNDIYYGEMTDGEMDGLGYFFHHDTHELDAIVSQEGVISTIVSQFHVK